MAETAAAGAKRCALKISTLSPALLQPDDNFEYYNVQTDEGRISTFDLARERDPAAAEECQRIPSQKKDDDGGSDGQHNACT